MAASSFTTPGGGFVAAGAGVAECEGHPFPAPGGGHRWFGGVGAKARMKASPGAGARGAVWLQVTEPRRRLRGYVAFACWDAAVAAVNALRLPRARRHLFELVRRDRPCRGHVDLDGARDGAGGRPSLPPGLDTPEAVVARVGPLARRVYLEEYGAATAELVWLAARDQARKLSLHLVVDAWDAAGRPLAFRSNHKGDAHSAADLARRLVELDPELAALVDLAIYTHEREMRLHGACKAEKPGNDLVLLGEDGRRVASAIAGEDDDRAPWSPDRRSLVTGLAGEADVALIAVPPRSWDSLDTKKALRAPAPSSSMAMESAGQGRGGGTKRALSPSAASAATAAGEEEGGGLHLPFPKIRNRDVLEGILERRFGLPMGKARWHEYPCRWQFGLGAEQARGDVRCPLCPDAHTSNQFFTFVPRSEPRSIRLGAFGCGRSAVVGTLLFEDAASDPAGRTLCEQLEQPRLATVIAMPPSAVSATAPRQRQRAPQEVIASVEGSEGGLLRLCRASNTVQHLRADGSAADEPRALHDCVARALLLQGELPLSIGNEVPALASGGPYHLVQKHDHFDVLPDQALRAASDKVEAAAPYKLLRFERSRGTGALGAAYHVVEEPGERRLATFPLTKRKSEAMSELFAASAYQAPVTAWGLREREHAAAFPGVLMVDNRHGGNLNVTLLTPGPGGSSGDTSDGRPKVEALLDAVLAAAQARGLAKAGDHVLEPVPGAAGLVYRRDAAGTSLRRFVRRCGRELGELARCSCGTYDDVVASLTKYDFPEMPTVQRDLDLLALDDGVLVLSDGRFVPFADAGAVDALLAERQQAQPLACEFRRVARHHLAGHAYTTSRETPLVDGVLRHQGLEEPSCRVLFFLLGRALFPVNRLDRLQVVPFLQGLAGTGKSTILDTFARLFAPETVGCINATLEKKFGLDRLVDKDVVLSPDIPKDLFDHLDLSIFKSMVTGEITSVARKYRDTLTVGAWSVPLVLAGNFVPTLRDGDGGGAFARRIVVVPFDHPVDHQDTTLVERIAADELVPFLNRALFTYLEDLPAVTAAGGIWQHLPQQLKDAREDKMRAADVFARFINARTQTGGRVYYVVAEDGARTEVSELKRFFRNYMAVHEPEVTMPKWDESLYVPQLHRLGCAVHKVKVCKSCLREPPCGCERAAHANRTMRVVVRGLRLVTEDVVEGVPA